MGREHPGRVKGDSPNPEIAVNIRVRGQVQGVGFRPFVYRLAAELGLSGWVRNDADGVEIEAQGTEAALDALLYRLKSEAPDLARVDEVNATLLEVAPQRSGFVIQASRAGHAHTAITPDAATCPACLEDILDPTNRRYRYPFTNCTHCGPRYTITRHLPYDRPSTSMAKFVQCPVCQAEYDNPLDRRFHAQPNACPVCGPRLWLVDAGDAITPTPTLPLEGGGGCSFPLPGGRPGWGYADPIAAALERLRAGKILAVKGLGGFHLMCDARNRAAVEALRRRKQREEKPFAVMLANVASIAPFAACGDAERQLLQARERPIVLLQKRPGCDAVLPGVAPGMAELGVLLPYAPLHTLLFHEAAGRPAGTGWPDSPQELALVCTSANPGGEPLVTGNEEALERLAGIADAFLMHDRDIVVGCDDSVVRGEGLGVRREGVEDFSPHPSRLTPHPQFIRRARGYTPRAIRLAQAGPSVLACGGWFKNTVCLTRGDEAFVSQHIGDLDNATTCRSLEETAQHLMGVLEIEPEIVAHDLHPDFFSSRFAADFARQRGIPAIAVQHHHAHIAAVLAEHRLTGLVLGLALDGIGLGSDGNAWGGELLRVEGASFQRLGHLKELALPGSDRAAREPWRMAASALHALGRGGEIERRFTLPAAATVREMLDRGLNAPATSSCGRLFDAAVGLLGVREVSAFEGQAAMLLEGLAQSHGPVAPMAGGYAVEGGVLSFLPLLDRLAGTDDAAFGAALFHATLAQGLAAWAEQSAAREGLSRVAMTGGCLLNSILRADLSRLLSKRGITFYHAHQVPPNDGGLALGQAWVAMQSKD